MRSLLKANVMASGCAGCATSRRGFLAGCAACAAGAAGLALGQPQAAAAAPGKKPRIRLVFSHSTPDQILWPNIGFDYEGRGKQLLAQLKPLCPDIEFLPVTVMNKAEADRVMAADQEVDGYLVCVLGMRGGAPMVTEAAGKAGRPMVVVEDHYAGPFSLGFNGRAAKGNWRAVCLATSRLQDVAEVVNCFHLLKRPGATSADFLAAAQVAYRKNIAAMGDMACQDDKVQAADVGECLQRLRQSAILLVGRERSPLAKAIEKELGTKVIPLKAPELHEAFVKADPAQAAQRADRWINAAEKMIEPQRDEVVKSGAMHLAMEALLKKHKAQAITINCLGGFYTGQLQAFPCLGFVELNNTGLVGACEGDLNSTITMLALGYLVGRPGFISDPVIDTAKNRIIYAHCVAPTRVFGPQGPVNPYHIRSHAEDRRGAAVRSILPLGYLTTTLELLAPRREVILHQAKAVENIDFDKACRTKLAAEVQGSVDKLFTHWAHGWHRVTFYGDLKEPVRALCKALDWTLTEEA